MQRSGERVSVIFLMSHAGYTKLRCVPIKECIFLQGQKGGGCMSAGNTAGHSPPPTHTCRTKEIFSSLCADTFANIALRLPWTVHQKSLSHSSGPSDATISLVELLVSEKHLFNDLNFV